jgi:predicted metal-dependent hydrolase
MQLEFLLGGRFQQQPVGHFLDLGSRRIGLRFVRHPRARRYVLRLCGGAARVTIPRGGSLAHARDFAQKNVPWIERQLLRQAPVAQAPRAWAAGTEIMFRGERTVLKEETQDQARFVCFATETVKIRAADVDFRSAVERHLWKLAIRELYERVVHFATLHRLEVRRVSVRNQRSRWGSCSRRRTISLNWRLVQTPDFVRDYIILHELAHLKEMNHSRRYWAEVARLCPDFKTAAAWLKRHSDLLR